MSALSNIKDVSERLSVVSAMSEALQTELHSTAPVKTPLLDALNAGIYISQTFEIPWLLEQRAKDFADILCFITNCKNKLELAQEMLAELRVLTQTPARPMNILAIELVALTLTSASMFIQPMPTVIGGSSLYK